MNNITRSLCICTSLIATLAVGESNLLTYEGQFEDLNGTPITEPIDLEFSFWNAEVGGSQLTDFVDLDEDVIPYQGGFVTTFVGDEPDLPVLMEIFDGSPVFLSIKANGEDLNPRKLITSAPLAFHSLSSDVLTVRRRTAPNQIIEAGNLISVDPNTKLAYKGFCQDIPENARTVPLVAREWLHTDQFIFIHDEKYGSVGHMVGDTFEWTEPALFSLVSGFSNFDVTVLDDNSFLLSYFDPNDRVFVVKKGTYNGTTLTFQNDTLCLLSPGTAIDKIDLEVLSPTSFIAVYNTYTGGSYNLYRNLVTITENGYEQGESALLLTGIQNFIGFTHASGEDYYLTVRYNTGIYNGLNVARFTLSQNQQLATIFFTTQTGSNFVEQASDRMLSLKDNLAVMQDRKSGRVYLIDGINQSTPSVNNFGNLGNFLYVTLEDAVVIDLNQSLTFYEYDSTLQQVAKLTHSCSQYIHRFFNYNILLENSLAFAQETPLESNRLVTKIPLGISLESSTQEEVIPIAISGAVPVYKNLEPARPIYFDGYGETTYNNPSYILELSFRTIDQETLLIGGR
jgi:hypothetical protein